MAHFLNRLAARALGVAHVAQPVIPTLFTPGFGLERNDGSDVVAEKIVGPNEKSLSSESARQATLPAPAESWNANSVSRGSLNAPLPGSFTDVEEKSSRSRQERLSLTANRLAITQPAVSPSVPDALTETHSENIEPSTPYRSSTSSVEPELEHVFGSRRQNAAELVSVREVPQTRRREPGGSNFGPALPANATAPARRERMAAPEPEAPIIRVTIGRVDVRAQFSTPTPSPVVARHARPGALSLDDYLKQRSEGKR